MKNFDETVKYASTLKRSAELPANHSHHAKRYTFTLTATSGAKKADGHAVVTVRGKSTTTTTTTTSSTTTTTTLCIGPVCV